MMTRTWPYGTTKHATITDVDSERTQSGKLVEFAIAVDSEGEGWVLLGRLCWEGEIKKGDVGVLVFTKGGPTGGYWKFKKE